MLRRFAARVTALLLLFTLLCTPALADAPLGSAPDAGAYEDNAIAVYDAQTMLSIAEHPDADYILMNDIDMAGVSWPAITFTGNFRGNGHTIINLENIAVSEETRVTYDGNRKTYDTHFGGLFAILENATVSNVTLLNVNYNVTYEGDCFLGGIAGFCSESTIEYCTVSGSVRLDIPTAKMFGVGGIIGYGNGLIKSSSADMTLINIDLDRNHKDEQFLGGVCGAGYPDIEGCNINLAGYISDHGYVHSGGLVGMYIVYPQRFSRDGFIKNNELSGFITFFEHNADRRAYCEAKCGEIMDWVFADSGNRTNFKRDERFSYDKNLLPHGDCTCTDFSESVIPAGGTNAGYTLHMCTECGYVYRDNYTLPEHALSSEPIVVVPATVTEPGISDFLCTDCGALIRKTVPTLSPTPMPTPTPEPTATPTPAPTAEVSDDNGPADSAKDGSGSSSGSPVLPIVCGILIAASVILLVRAIIHAKRMKNLK